MRVLSLDLKVERDSQFNTAGGSEFQVRGAAVLNDRLANDVHRNGTHSSGTDEDLVLHVPVRNEMCWLRPYFLRPMFLIGFFIVIYFSTLFYTD